VSLRTDGTPRPSKDETFLRVAEILAELSTCPSGARHGAIVVVDRRIVATGYGSPASGVAPCERCWLREEYARTGKKDWSVCPSVHAELNALLFAARAGVAVLGGTLYVTREPCRSCMRAIANAGVARIVTPGGKVLLTP
jgi:dCMP deaminase